MSEREINKELIDRIAERIPIYRRRVAIDCIEDVLSAVRDGKLDEALGVVGRADLSAIDEIMLQEWVLSLPCDYGILIALRREEEKDE